MSGAKKLRALEDENNRLKRMLADAMNEHDRKPINRKTGTNSTHEQPRSEGSGSDQYASRLMKTAGSECPWGRWRQTVCSRTGWNPIGRDSFSKPQLLMENNRQVGGRKLSSALKESPLWALGRLGVRFMNAKPSELPSL